MSEARARRIETSRHSESAAKVTAEAEAAAEAAAARTEAAAAAEEKGEELAPEPEPVGPCEVSLIIKADVQVRSVRGQCLIYSSPWSAAPMVCRTQMRWQGDKCGAHSNTCAVLTS